MTNVERITALTTSFGRCRFEDLARRCPDLNAEQLNRAIKAAKHLGQIHSAEVGVYAPGPAPARIEAPEATAWHGRRVPSVFHYGAAA